MNRTRNPNNVGRPQKGLYRESQFSAISRLSPQFEGNYCIYGLAARNEPEIVKYVGFTSNNLNCRYNMHQYDAKKNKTPKQKWILELLEQGEKIILVLLEQSIVTKDEACSAEKRWIADLQTQATLTNLTIGGLGTTGWRKRRAA